MTVHPEQHGQRGESSDAWLGAPRDVRAGVVPAKWKTVFEQCPLCGENGFRRVFVHHDCGEVVRCSACGLRYTRSRRLAPWIQLRRESVCPLPGILIEKEEQQTLDFDAILGRLERMSSSRTLLEIGAMTGHFQVRAREGGWNAVGLEPDPWAAEYGRKTFGVQVREATITEAKFPSASFDVVGMLHVMEHLTEPLETLREISRVLKPTGVLAIEIPIVDAAAARLLGRRHRHYVFDHTLFMTRQTCTEFLERTGFRIERREFTGRHIKLGRLTRGLTQHFSLVGKPMRRAISLLNLEQTPVAINLRDNMRVYARPVAR
jgi:SAM-dependent methyltransferase